MIGALDGVAAAHGVQVAPPPGAAHLQPPTLPATAVAELVVAEARR